MEKRTCALGAASALDANGASNKGTIMIAVRIVIAHHTIHHEPGPNAWSTKGAISPEDRMPMPGPA